MSEDLSDILNNVKKMVDNGDIPDNLKEMLNNINNSDSSEKNTSSSLSDLLNTVQNSNKTNTSSTASSNEANNNSSTDLNIDIQTIFKMKNIIDAMNKKDDPRANLLYSLKPYLRDSRKSKLDQYVNLLNMTKIADIMKNEKKENNNNA